MKTVILAGLDNQIFSAADMLNPKELKLIGYATTMEQAWNIYENNGAVKETMPIMPIDAAVSCEPELMILAAANEEDDMVLKHMLLRADYRGEVLSLFEQHQKFSVKTAIIRKLSWRLEELGVAGAVADLGACRGDFSWQLNALMPERTLYLFDTFTGYDYRDVEKEQELGFSDVKAGDYSLSQRECEQIENRLMERMPYPEMIVIKKGWFPETAYDLEDEQYALVHLDTGLYAPTYAGIQYFFSAYEQGRRYSCIRL